MGYQLDTCPECGKIIWFWQRVEQIPNMDLFTHHYKCRHPKENPKNLITSEIKSCEELK